jgi:hypothetical protein
MVRIKNILLYTVALFIVLGCQKNKCFHGTGKLKSETRKTAYFTEIKAEKNINIILTPDSNNQLTIEAGEKMLPYIETNVTDGTLWLRNKSKCNFLRSFKNNITVTVPAARVKKISHTGSGNISSTTTLYNPVFKMDISDGSGSYNIKLESDSVFLWQHTGPADFTLSGKTNYLYTYTAANGWFYLDNLKTNNAHINHNGTGDVLIWAENSLFIELYNMGNIQYRGNPKITVSAHTGSGKILKLP